MRLIKERTVRSVTSALSPSLGGHDCRSYELKHGNHMLSRMGKSSAWLWQSDMNGHLACANDMMGNVKCRPAGMKSYTWSKQMNALDHRHMWGAGVGWLALFAEDHGIVPNILHVLQPASTVLVAFQSTQSESPHCCCAH